MFSKWRRWLRLAGIAGGLGLGAVGMAQSTPFQPFKALFASKTVSSPKSVENNRMVEMQVELAWLSDRTTFPYFLEARLKGTNLEVRGYVSTKTVREQAINLAKLNCPLPVTDLLKEHPSLAIHPVPRAPEQLKSSVQTALREAFPGQQLTVHCKEDGTVEITGSVRSWEQKLAVSQSLRRLHGCISVANLTDIELPQPSPPAGKSPAVANAATAGTVTTPKSQTAAKMTASSSTKSLPASTNEAVAQPATTKPMTVAKTTTSNSAKSPAAPANEAAAQPVKVAQEQQRRGSFKMFGGSSQAPVQQTEASTVKITTVDAPAAKALSSDAGLVFRPGGSSPTKVKPGEPFESQGVVVVQAEDAKMLKPAPAPPAAPAPPPPATRQVATKQAPKTAAGSPITVNQIKKRIETAIPGVRNVKVTFTSKTDVRVECTIRANDDSAAIAGQILSLQELAPPYNVDLRLQLGGPENR